MNARSLFRSFFILLVALVGMTSSLSVKQNPEEIANEVADKIMMTFQSRLRLKDMDVKIPYYGGRGFEFQLPLTVILHFEARSPRYEGKLQSFFNSMLKTGWGEVLVPPVNIDVIDQSAKDRWTYVVMFKLRPARDTLDKILPIDKIDRYYDLGGGDFDEEDGDGY